MEQEPFEKGQVVRFKKAVAFGGGNAVAAGVRAVCTQGGEQPMFSFRLTNYATPMHRVIRPQVTQQDAQSVFELADPIPSGLPEDWRIQVATFYDRSEDSVALEGEIVTPEGVVRSENTGKGEATSHVGNATGVVSKALRRALDDREHPHDNLSDNELIDWLIEYWLDLWGAESYADYVIAEEKSVGE